MRALLWLSMLSACAGGPQSEPEGPRASAGAETATTAETPRPHARPAEPTVLTSRDGDCEIEVRIDDAATGVVRRDWLEVAAAFSALLPDSARPSELPIDAPAAERELCANHDACAWDVAFGLAFDEGGLASTGAAFPLDDGRIRVVAPLAIGEANYRCSAELAAAPEGDGVLASAVSTGVGEDEECYSDVVETAHAFVDRATGRALTVRVVLGGLNTLDRPPSPVTVTRGPRGVHVLGCAMDADVPFPG